MSGRKKQEKEIVKKEPVGNREKETGDWNSDKGTGVGKMGKVIGVENR